MLIIGMKIQLLLVRSFYSFYSFVDLASDTRKVMKNVKNDSGSMLTDGSLDHKHKT